MTAGPGDGSVVSPGPTWTQLLAAARDDSGLSRVRDLIRLCESAIVAAGLSGFNSMGTPRKDAEALVYETLRIRDHSARYLGAVVTSLERTAVLDLLERRVSGPTPVPYLTGEAFFAGRRFTVRPGVFIPRSALGSLLDEVLAEVTWSSPATALELGCGSGALGLSIALRVPDLRIDLMDVDPLAVEVTRANIVRHRLEVRARAAISDVYAGVDPAVRYDLVVANLPYVPSALLAQSGPEIQAEPEQAIYQPGDGLDLVRAALEGAAPHLSDQGALVLEVGTGNAAAVRDLLPGRGHWWTRDGQAAGIVSLTRDELKA